VLYGVKLNLAFSEGQALVAIMDKQPPPGENLIVLQRLQTVPMDEWGRMFEPLYKEL
jgi:hypothetical protein